MQAQARALLMMLFLLIPTLFGIGYLDRQRVLRIDAQNMEKARQLAAQFQSCAPIGSTRSTVEDCLRRTPFSVQKTDFDALYEVETASEQSPIFGCGRWSVGFWLSFSADGHLTSVKPTGWSLDCM